MRLTPGARKLTLTAHVICSVGWLGAVGVSLVLAVAGLVSENVLRVRGVYLTLELLGWYVLIPLSLASLLTGLVQSLGTTWGLFGHYWVVVKLVLNLLATVVLLLYMQTLGYLADRAADSTATGRGIDVLRDPSPVLHSAGALLLLLAAVTLSIYKPRGLTSYGRRMQRRPARQ